jgi:glucuronate isomerase
MKKQSFITDDFLIHTPVGKELFHNYAKDMPIYDYHSHLPQKDIADNRKFNNLFELWLEGDHYKWRAMRTNGVNEKFVTGDADPYDKFLAFAKTVPQCLGNPLYHWTHLELKRLFGIDDLLNEKTAPEIWKIANEKLSANEFRVHGILKHFNVALICTTDDPCADLKDHSRIKELGIGTKVYPTFRPDSALCLLGNEKWKQWISNLEKLENIKISTASDLLSALKARHQFFHDFGARLSDHGLEQAAATPCSDEEAEQLFQHAISGKEFSQVQKDSWSSWLMLHFGRMDAEKGWVKQLHLGALRNNNKKLFQELGADIGCDSIGDFPQARNLSEYLGTLTQSDSLPKTILYNLNPADNYVFATMIGNFQDGSISGKVQFGSGWWFLDQKDGMIWQLKALANLGVLSTFVGMLTDSRSFLSFPRHEYFRRILCNLIGEWVEKGEIPNDMELLSELVQNISFNNAKNYFGLEL